MLQSSRCSFRLRFCVPLRRSVFNKRCLISASVVKELDSTNAIRTINEIQSRPLWIQQQLADEQLDSTPEQQAIVLTSFSLNLLIMTRGLSHLASWDGSISTVLAVLTSFITADLLSGVYHWAIDNYGDKTSPMFGKQIEGFQRHHRYPWTITYRQFCNNIHPICSPAAMTSLLILLLSSPPVFDVFYSTGCSFVILSQQFHAWAHTRPKELNPWVLKLQKAGVLISTSVHCLHHRKPFNCNYCIVSGFWNPILDQSGILYSLEKVIYLYTGVKPRSWNEEHDQNEKPVDYFAN
eukprot:g6455.t1